jgi:hypothetical protein
MYELRLPIVLILRYGPTQYTKIINIYKNLYFFIGYVYISRRFVVIVFLEENRYPHFDGFTRFPQHYKQKRLGGLTNSFGIWNYILLICRRTTNLYILTPKL